MIDLKEVKKLNTEGRWYSLPLYPDVEFKIKRITPKQIEQSIKKYTTITFDKKTHQKIEIVDPEKQREVLREMVMDSVLDWKGITENGKEVEFSKAALKTLLDNFTPHVDEKIDAEGNVEKVYLFNWIFDTARGEYDDLESEEKN